MTDDMKRDFVEIILERVIDWPREALDEFFRLIDRVEAKYGLGYELTDDDREAIRRGLEDMKAGRLVDHEEVLAMFERYENDGTKKAGGG